MHPHAELIKRFYFALDQKDGQAMAGCYHEEAIFKDPVFPELTGEAIGAMWIMLCRQAKTLEITTSRIQADDHEGQAKWTARYDYGKPPRHVYNQIKASFEFREGKIFRHEDQFSLWKWSRMALGPLGLVLGWHSKVQDRIRQQAGSNLKKYMESLNSR